MAKIEEIIPFILFFETGGAPSCFQSACTSIGKTRVYNPSLLTPEQQFNECKKHGFANDPDDAGGATMCGITLVTYKTYCKHKGYPAPTILGLKNISYKRWLDVLKTLFWDRWKADEIKSQALANILVDWVWASGGNGIKIPQRILGVTQDGIVGPKTLSATNAANEAQLFTAIHEARIKFVNDIVARKPSQKKFINGWKRRINAITLSGLKYN